jgi:hypothetical protein
MRDKSRSWVDLKKQARSDPTAPGQARKYCHWLHHPWATRCPRYSRTGEECWCRFAVPGVDDAWPWRVVPPLADADAPAWNYDDRDGAICIR